MNLRTIGTGSAGNCYLLESESEILMIECGLPIKQIKQALSFSFSRVVGCIVTHEHGDHAKGVKDLMACGVNVWATNGTHEALGSSMNHRAHRLNLSKEVKLGSFRVRPFHIHHDAAEPCGFLIQHPECGLTLFLTDTFYCDYTFPGLNNIIIEANFSKEIIDRKMREGASPEFLRNRILKSHLSLETCITSLKANDLSNVNNIVLIHLSDNNSDEALFQKLVHEATGKNVTIASNGQSIAFNKTPF